jgi:hypothetical protein
MLRYALMLFAMPWLASADLVNIGLFSFDSQIAGSPGVNAFTISNFTGDPNTGGFALPPDFPVFTSVTFGNVVVTLDTGSSLMTFNLSDIAPGPVSPTELLFADTLSFVSATISFTLDQTALTLYDNSTFTAAPSLTAVILPSLGATLSAGNDFVVLQAPSAVSAVPEPSGTLMLAAALGLLLYRRRRA